MAGQSDGMRPHASSPCFTGELEPGPDGHVAVDPQARQDVMRWRKAERERLIAARMEVPADQRSRFAQEVGERLMRLIKPGPGKIVSLYWPFRGELDLRDWAKAVREQGARTALPVVIAKGQPLVFREWQPGARMERGVWNIPVPANGAEVVPDVVIAPLVGFDAARYRLGYGGGFFDRTLAALSPRPLSIGVGLNVQEVTTIYPQPHDIPMDMIVTEDGWVRLSEDGA